MKKMYPILAAVLFVAALALLTGAEVNPIQGVYALILMGAARVCVNRAESARSESRKVKSKKAIRYQEAA